MDRKLAGVGVDLLAIRDVTSIANNIMITVSLFSLFWYIFRIQTVILKPKLVLLIYKYAYAKTKCLG